MMKVEGIKYRFLILLVGALMPFFIISQPVMDGNFDGVGVWGSPIATADGVEGWAASNAKNLYMVEDCQYIYLGADIKASPWMAWAFLINRNVTGDDLETWSRSISYNHSQLPDMVCRGTFGEYAETHLWNGQEWTGIGEVVETSEYGENIVDDNQDGWVEVRIRKGMLGATDMLNIQFYITGDKNEHGSFDAVPDDNNSNSWDHSMSFISLSNYTSGIQVTPLVEITPNYPEDNVQLTITFDASCSALEGASKVYLHSGVSTSQGSPFSFDRTIGNWGQDDGIGEMTSLGANMWSITISDIKSYYGVAATEDVFGLNYLFRSADGSIKEDAGGNNYFEPVNTGDFFTLDNPELSPYLLEVGNNFDVMATASSIPGYWTLKEIDPVDDSFISRLDSIPSATTSYNYSLGTTTTAVRKFKLEAKFGTIIKYKTFEVVGYNPVIIEPKPAGTVPGINYRADDTKVTLVLHAPTKTRLINGNGTNYASFTTSPKEIVYVIGDFNNWTPGEAYKMKRDTGAWDESTDPNADYGDYWWITLDGLTPGQEYVYQYLIDGQVQVGDPYCEKVSDPDDVFISSSVYPGLISYPSQAVDRASVFRTNQSSYNWTAPAFSGPTNDRLNIYELHFRDFTEEGTYLAAIEKLDYIKNLGINAIHVMPVSEFEGNSSWGYNPNFYFAPDKAYGTKDDLKQFIDECHKREIQVFNDLVLNHAFYSNVMARMWWNDALNRPADDSPFFNPEHKMVSAPAGWWGADWNHESEHVQKMVDRALDFWLQEYKFDGFRFDFTKGIGQTAQDSNDPWASSYDEFRISLLKRLVNGMWSRNPGSVAIFEHLANPDEDKELADHGILMWSGVPHHEKMKEFALGYKGEDIYNTGHYTGGGKNFTFANWMSYAESHDEQRLGYEVVNFADLVKDAPDTTEQQRLMIDRLKIAAGFNLLFPGPRMIWQFQELGYEVDIDFNGRTGEKPVRWWYYDNPKRKELYTLMSKVFKLRNDYNLYQSNGPFPDYGNTGNGAAPLSEPRYMKFNIGGGKYAMIVANLDPRNGHDYTAGFPTGGTWYRYNGDPMTDGTMITASSAMPLDSSEMFLLTNFPLDSCNQVSKVVDATVPNTLRSVVGCAMPGDTVKFEFPVEGNLIRLDTPLTINKNLVIEATEGQDVIIDGSGLPGQVIHIPAGVDVKMIGVQIHCNGGNCMNVEGQLTIKDLQLKKPSP